MNKIIILHLQLGAADIRVGEVCAWDCATLALWVACLGRQHGLDAGCGNRRSRRLTGARSQGWHTLHHKPSVYNCVLNLGILYCIGDQDSEC